MRHVEDSGARVSDHRIINRYHCPPTFLATVFHGTVEDKAQVENISGHGLRIRTSSPPPPATIIGIELETGYVAPVRLHARVQWVLPQEEDHVIGLSIQRIGILEWLRYNKVLAQLKKELW